MDKKNHVLKSSSFQEGTHEQILKLALSTVKTLAKNNTLCECRLVQYIVIHQSYILRPSFYTTDVSTTVDCRSHDRIMLLGRSLSSLHVMHSSCIPDGKER